MYLKVRFANVQCVALLAVLTVSITVRHAEQRWKVRDKMSKCQSYLSEDCNNKDCLKCVLDKIRERVELEKLGYPPSAGYYRAIMKVLQIIDKYKAEGSEE